jgi:hypothetical protein
VISGTSAVFGSGLNFPNAAWDKKPPVRDREKGRWRELAGTGDAKWMSEIMENRVMIIFDFVGLIDNIKTAAALFLILI